MIDIKLKYITVLLLAGGTFSLSLSADDKIKSTDLKINPYAVKTNSADEKVKSVKSVQENTKAKPVKIKATNKKVKSVKATQVVAKAKPAKIKPTEVTVKDVCKKISKKLASVSYRECNIGFELSGAKSVQGIPIIVKEYPPLASRAPQSKVLVIGGIHGDEYSSVSVVYKWLNKLERFHSGLFHWKIVPLLNPDGLLRKRSQRMNANGVDLNRNFPTQDWHKLSKYYWVERTYKNPRRYPGKDPLSEPESRWLFDLIEEFKPDVIIAVHAPYGVLDFDGPPRAPKRLGQLYLNLLGAYPGSLGNYAGVEQEIPVITIELKHAGIMPSRKEISNIWGDMISWLKKNTPKKAPETLQQTTSPVKDHAGPS